MNIRIKRIDRSLPLPAYQTPGSVAFDIYSRIDMTIAPKTLSRIPTNLIIQTPHGYMLVVAPRSSTPSKKGLSIPHGIGIIDQDFCGPKDEINMQVYNFTEGEVSIQRGERVCQGVFVPIERAEWQEIDSLDTKTRGGFGSTG